MDKLFRAKVFQVEDTRDVKGGNVRQEKEGKQTYKYGGIRLQSHELNGLVGKIVVVRIKEVNPKRR